MNSSSSAISMEIIVLLVYHTSLINAEGNGQAENTALSLLGFDLNNPPYNIRQKLRNVKPQTCSLRPYYFGVGRPVKLTEYILPLFFRNTDAVVRNGKLHEFSVEFGNQNYAPALLGINDCVRNKNINYGFQEHPIGCYLNFSGNFEGKYNPSPFGNEMQSFVYFIQKLFKGKSARIHGWGFPLKPYYGKKIIDQFDHAVVVLQNEMNIFLLFLGKRPDLFRIQRLDEPLNARKRRAQLMRRNSEKLHFDIFER